MEGTDDVEPVGRLVMVFEDEKPAFERFINALKNEDLGLFEEDSVRLADVRERVDEWHEEFFSEVDVRIGGGLIEDLFSIARHMARNEKQVPKFFPFDVRDHHDLDAVAQDHLDQSLNDRAKAAALRESTFARIGFGGSSTTRILSSNRIMMHALIEFLMPVSMAMIRETIAPDSRRPRRFLPASHPRS